MLSRYNTQEISTAHGIVLLKKVKQAWQNIRILIGLD